MEHPAYTLAVISSAGGVMGYRRTRSLPSLIAGLVIGLGYGVSGYYISKNQRVGIDGAAASSAVLLAGSLPRVMTLKPVPIGLSVLGSTALYYYGKKAYEERTGV